ncbi:hypothetical protein DPMN_040748 [Dreissena polymorpha]|uniref:Uncharacterized protein n=1 Tax=Dreissena polymorpha TaxID=45954 RepID=A0A9D4CXB2_DREPO|nr:hypothetical protein DPMN_040748 [Dreissena polymorpha]
MGGNRSEFQYRTNLISQKSGGFWINVSTKKTKIIVDSTNDIPIHGMKLEEVTSFKYLAVSLSTHDTGIAEVRIIIAKTTAAIHIANSCPTKCRLYKSLIVAIILYRLRHGRFTWTHNARHGPLNTRVSRDFCASPA